MKSCASLVMLLSMLFGGYPVAASAGELVCLLRPERSTPAGPYGPATRAGEASGADRPAAPPAAADSGRAQPECSAAELGDDVLGTVRGKAIDAILPRFEAGKVSGIILWDETKTNGLTRLNLGNGRNLNQVSR